MDSGDSGDDNNKRLESNKKRLKLDHSYPKTMTSINYWQQGINTVHDRDLYMLRNQIFADCSFIVGKEGGEKETIHCHRYQLVKSSSVFSAMLYGDLSANQMFDIPIIDAEPQEFKKFLEYIYTGEFKYSSDYISLSEYTIAFGVLYLAKKYLMPDSYLQQLRCFLWRYMAPGKKAWHMAEHAAQIGEHELEEVAWIVISSSALLPRYASFVTQNTMLKFVKSSHHYEHSLFEFCLFWCKPQGTPNNDNVITKPQDTPNNDNVITLDNIEPDHFNILESQAIREYLNPFLPYIRFLTMSKEELASIFTLCKHIFTEEEKANIIANTVLPGICKPLKGFSTETTKRSRLESAEMFVFGCPFEDKVFLGDFQQKHNFFTFFRCQTVNRHCIRVPLQVKPQNAVSDTYEENFTIWVSCSDYTNRYIRRSFSHKCTAEYGSEIDIQCSSVLRELDEGGEVDYGYVVYHVSGKYPVEMSGVTMCMDD